MKKLLLLLVPVILLLLVAANPVQITLDACNLLHTFDNGERLFLCPPETVATPAPTSTNEPTVAPTPTDHVVNNVPDPNDPLCETHDPAIYHGLYDAVNDCHYDHTHGDNPHQLDALFGDELWTYLDGDLVQPWHTHRENETIKHKSYIWLVETNLECYSQFAAGCITDFRALVHNDLYNPFPLQHSAVLEARVCDEANPDICGHVIVGGQEYTGDLTIDGQTVLDRDEPANSPRPIMLHYDQTGNANFATWYPVFESWMRVATQIGDMWGYYPLPEGPLPTTEDALEFVRLNGNATSIEPHVISFGTRRANVSVLDPDGDGLLNYHGMLDASTGALECSDICSPLVVENVPIVDGLQFQFRGSPHEFDIFFDGQSSGWMVFPGFQE